MKRYIISASIIGAIFMSGCSTTSNPVGGNVYDASQLNQEQNAQNVQIIQVSPAKIAVDNSENRRLAQTAGGVGGVVAGSMVGDKKIVDGVTIAYKTSIDGKIKTSTQGGKLCEFQTGKALMIITKQNETRIQPNSVCLEK